MVASQLEQRSKQQGHVVREEGGVHEVLWYFNKRFAGALKVLLYLKFRRNGALSCPQGEGVGGYETLQPFIMRFASVLVALLYLH